MHTNVITSHSVFLRSPQSKDDYTVANASIVVNDCVKINGLRIIHLNGRITVKWPANQNPDNESRHVVIPTNKAFRELVESTLFDTYSRMADDEKVKSLAAEIETLKAMEIKAIEEGKDVLAFAYFKAIEHINNVIQQS